MDKAREYEFLNELVTGASMDALRAPLISYLTHAFDAQTVTILQFHRDGVPAVLLSHVPDAALREFFDLQYARVGYILDPFYTAAFGEAEYAASQLRQVAPDRFETSEYYARYYAETRLADELGATLRTSPETALHLSLGRTVARGRYRAGELRHFRLLAPILMNKLRIVEPGTGHAPAMPGAADLIQRYRTLGGPDRKRLSQREAQIAALIVQGHSSRATGLRLGISDQTVKVHRRNIYKKLRISSQNELFSLLVQDMRGV